jgi:hypothetical protein
MIATALVACSASSRENVCVDWVAPREHQIVVTSKSFSAATPIRIRYTDSWQTEEYALFRAEGMILENEQIRRLVSEIGIRPQVELSDVREACCDINAGSHRPAAIDTGRGKDRSTDTGNPCFPFKFARYYSESGGRELK